ncbi:uncharacterized protein FFMR_14632 [Fusarium fujikuroi]|nr:uncharacterized protein Y057_5088 [Fusarium fujikuroi]SCN71160.1 uncharacterized protein FFE2_02220 [Fusarium fujikuroi]SCO14319.1 uncharacterized protein FFC1_12116 [Fusarium fujikuroi]SCO57476.1 uncharacterized protein FFMR_14632 [Fusarium fujikuroi]SCV54352.1 uncharacterized protein FFFS_11224 [Fusarium fujikuroi]
MDPTLEDLRPKSDDGKFLSHSYEERWSRLQPVIVELYTRRRGGDGRSATLDQVVEFMRTYYSFHAAATEYRRRFKDWGVTKRMVKEDKDAITSALARKKRPGASMSAVTTQHDGEYKPLVFKKLKRHLISRKACLRVAPGLLSSWKLPYVAFVASLPKNPEAPSPFGNLGATPNYLHVQSPETLTPGRATAGASPRMQLVYEKHKEHCTSLFLQGRLEQLLISLPREDRVVIFDYFHDYYIHSFALAKNWGREVPNSTQAFDLIPQTPITHSPWTPSAFLNLSSGPSSPEISNATNVSFPPTQLCNWSIHSYYGNGNSMAVTTSPDSKTSTDIQPSSFVVSLHQSMVLSNFTTIPKSDLPLAHDLITRSLEEHPATLQLEAWKLAIMAGNRELLDQLCEENGFDPPEGIEALHPFHLAAAYLDGGNQCCGVFTDLFQIVSPTFAFYHNIDDHGHTILDALIVTVLRSHTNIQPDDVSYGFHSPTVFPGEESDVCGRWDSETPTVRELFRQGYARIPTKWKHPFCHTAVQAVCHSLVAIFASPASPNIHTQSGLFVRRCTTCGLELKLRPLHTIVVVAFYLAQLGMPGETLFGALAMMTCLIALGADVSTKADISVEEILRSSDAGECRHKMLSPLELIKAIPGGVIEAWSESCRIGWGCLTETLVLVVLEREQERSSRSQGSMGPLGHKWPGTLASSLSDSLADESCWVMFQEECHDNWLKLPCSGQRIGLLWASIQTEVLTYRRIREGDSWISENFSMKALKAWLEAEDTELSMPLVQKRMFKVHTRCGWFGKAMEFLCPTAEDVCRKHFMNMDIDSKTSYIEQPDLQGAFESLEQVEDGKE